MNFDGYNFWLAKLNRQWELHRGRDGQGLHRLGRVPRKIRPVTADKNDPRNNTKRHEISVFSPAGTRCL
jgi:hypothetical protein